ncbi:MAG: PilZ domain-containing protein [Desulfobacterales bacterium]|nr:MAG: PilZ domain-containing protein [Desulfobacterales bacterium]
MNDHANTENIEEKRSEPRIILDQYYYVEFVLQETGHIYKFKLRDISSNGLCILVNETSAVLKHLKVGETLDMTYHPPQPSTPVESLKTKIMHITKDEQAPFKGHYLVGLSISSREPHPD